MKRYFLFLILLFLCLFSYRFSGAQSIVINEVSQGPGGSKEYVEFLVTGTPTCDTIPCLDLRGWIFDDNNGYLNGGATTGVGIASGACRFDSTSFWSCIPAGTIILIYNDGDSNPSLPSNDVSMADGNCQLVIPISSTLFEHHTSQPNSTISAYPTTGWNAGGNWTPISMANSEDGFQIYSATNTTTPVFSIGWGPSNSNGDIYISGSATDDVFYASDCNFTSGASWITGCAGDISACGSDDQTPGTPNTASQSTCIGLMNNNCTVISPLIADAGNDTTICPGSSITIGGDTSASGGIPGYTYVWTPSAGLNDDTLANPVASPTTTTTYILSVQDSRGCDTTDTVVITVNPEPVADAGPDLVLCAGDSISIGGTPTASGAGPFTYSWIPTASLDSPNVSNPMAFPGTTTSFIVTISDSLGCTDTDTMDITVVPPFSIDLGNDTTLCSGASLTLDPGAGYSSYNWSTGAVSQTINVSSAGTYAVQVTDGSGCTASDTIEVYLSNPIVNLGNDTTICQGASHTLNAGAGYVSYSWSTGGVSQTISVSNAGNYWVQVTDSVGCTASDTFHLSISDPIVNLGNDTSICTGTSVSLDAGPGFTSYAWSTGAVSQTINVNSTGTYSVQVTDSIGCVGTDTIEVWVSNPQVDLGQDTAFCFPDSVQLNAGPGYISYSWSTGATSQNIYASSTGTYSVQVTDSIGCMTTDTIEVIVQSNLNINLGNDTAVCNGQSVTFDAGSGYASYSWSTGAGSQTITASTSGSYSVQVTDAGGCTGADTVSLTVNSLPVADAGTDVQICLGDSVQIGGSPAATGNGPFSYSWSPLAGLSSTTVSNPYSSVQNTTTYGLNLTDNNGCQDTDSIQVTVITPLKINLGNDTTFCDGNSITLNAGGGFSSYNWSTGATTQQITVSTSGTYWVEATESSGCTSSDTVNITVSPLPSLSFNANTGCQSSAVNFNNTSGISSGSINTYNWDFGDGNSSSSTSPSHAYSSGGNYTVTLTGISDQGCMDSLSKSINIDPDPSADFSADTVCEGSSTCFSDLSTVSSGSISAWQWDFGDGSATVNGQSPCYTYAAAGTYNVTLNILTDSGCTDNITKTIEVLPVPSAAFSAPDSICLGDTIAFTDNSSGTITTYDWRFGDGNTSGLQNPSHVYGSTGSYTVQLIAHSSGCSDTTTAQVEVSPVPTADFIHSSVCEGEPTIFTDSSSGNINSYLWNFGYGTVSTQQNNTISYPGSGTYQVSLEVTNIYGCSDIVTKAVEVHPLPNAAIYQTSGCVGERVQLNDSSFISTGNIVSWNWDFDNGMTSNQQNPGVTYNSAGNYQVQLVVESAEGCRDTTTAIVAIHPLPVPSFINNSGGCLPFKAEFFNTSTIDLNSNIVNWFWDFGDGTTSTAENPVHVYEKEGVYSVTLIAVSDKGCSDTVSVTNAVEVFPSPVIDFDYHPEEISEFDPVVQFLNKSTGAVSYLWKFGDGDSSTVVNPEHTYSGPGKYLVTLEGWNEFGCRDTAMDTLEIKPEFIIYIPNAFTPDQDRTNDIFKAEGIGIDEFKMMIFNRWGEKIFTSNSLDRGWDGTMEGSDEIVQTGVYVYRIEVMDVFGNPHDYIGKVTLLK